MIELSPFCSPELVERRQFTEVCKSLEAWTQRCFKSGHLDSCNYFVF